MVAPEKGATAKLACPKWLGQRNSVLGKWAFYLRNHTLPGRDSNLAMAGWVKCDLQRKFLQESLAAARNSKLLRWNQVFQRYYAGARSTPCAGKEVFPEMSGRRTIRESTYGYR